MTEMPSLKMLEAHFKDRGLLILAFNTESGGNRFNAKMSGIEMPDKLIFSFDKDQLRPYQVEALPLSVLVDRFGIVRDVFRGPRNWLDPAILRSIEAVLK
jgi:hypothetical protein